ncbi:MAG: glycerol transporter [Sclerophora amabilis]|nr:MAG: glycerol transporter [Sclerophora amabilis]
MACFAQLRRLYSLDTLDTRFTTSSSTPFRGVSSTNRDLPDPAKEDSSQELTPRVYNKEHNAVARDTVTSAPKGWRKLELPAYYAIVSCAVPLMIKVTYDVSKVLMVCTESHPSYPVYSHLLSEGWMAGRKVDNSDLQYAGFRGNVPYLLLLLVLHPSLRRMYDYFFSSEPPRTSPPSSQAQASPADRASSPIDSAAAADARLEQRVSFDFRFAIFFICALHGISALKIMLILYINYKLATRLPRSQVPVATWVFSIGMLFANELCGGYRLRDLGALISPAQASLDKSASSPRLLVNLGAWLDGFGGLMPRWEVFFKMTVLRLISFNLDYHWSFNLRGGSPVEVTADIHKKKQLDPTNLSERDRLITPAKPHEYSFRNYVAYTLYSPLYLAGPIVTFNDYVSQLRYPAASITNSRTILYGVRFILCLLCMEIMLHFLYAVAICKAKPAWETYTPFQLSMLGYFNLHIIWLKLLLPWRFFRLWALIDGIDPPENMVRCMSDNYSALAFWRGWHRSFNRWIIRYIYVPLGGSGGPGGSGLLSKLRPVGNFLIVFTFVAMWHDINLRLLMWGWLVSLFVLPEVIAGFLFPRRKWENHKDAYRILCGVGAVGNILMMMAANLVGFAVGFDGLKGLVQGIVGSYSGLVFLATACFTLYVGVQVMFEIREDEARQGIRMKC